MIEPHRIPYSGETWDQAKERAYREDAVLVIKDDGRHKVGPKKGYEWLYEEVIRTYSCPTCLREVTKVDGEGPWVHVNSLIDPAEDEDE